jgi:uncharacterized membrane protein YhfC
MLYFTHLLNALLMIVLPILLGVFLARRLGLKWGLYFVGAATFIASQVVHLPLNAGLTALFANNVLPAPPAAWKLPFNAVVLGLTAGLCEEIARYLVYRHWIKSARTWREALMFGAGHGGIEAIVFGALAGLTFVNMVVLRDMDVATLPIPADQQALAAKQIAAYWAAPWYASLLGAVERAFTLSFHVSAAAMVLQTFRRNNLLWLGAAILWHAAADAAVVFVVGTWGVYWAEAAVGAFGAASLGITFALRPGGAEAATEIESAAPAPASAPSRAGLPNAEADLRRKMDETRFTSQD